MNEAAAHRIVVGIDGSGTARGAVRWAAREAARRGVPLRIVYADVAALPVLPEIPGVPWSHAHRTAIRAEVENWLTEAADAAVEESPRLHPQTEAVPGTPGSVLIEESRSAALLVVGDRGFGGFTGLLAGSVAVAVTAHGHADTVVVRTGHDRPPGSEPGPVVVGIDGSPHTANLLDHAFRRAAEVGVPLHVVHTWHLAGISTRWMRVGPPTEEIQQGAERLLAEQLAGWGERFPDVAVHRFPVEGSPSATLLEHAAGAELVVVGARGRGGFTGMLLGSTSQALIHHSPCPVLVVRTPGR